MILKDETAEMRARLRASGLHGNQGIFLSRVGHFVSCLAASLDETERLARHALETNGKADGWPRVSWRLRIGDLNGKGDVPPLLCEMADAAERLRDAIIDLGGEDVKISAERFADFFPNISSPYQNVCEFADGLDALREAAEKLPSVEFEYRYVAVARKPEAFKPTSAPEPARRPSVRNRAA